MKTGPQFYVIVAGLIAAVLSQYAFLLPIPGAYLILAGAALVAATVAGIWMLVDRARG